jgi:Flp pilus assembly protein TadD
MTKPVKDIVASNPTTMVKGESGLRGNNKNRFSAKNLKKAAIQCQANDQLDEALKLYQLYTYARPQDKTVWINLGVALRKKRQYEAAIACYRRALQLDDEDAGAWSNLGNALKDLYRYQEACSAHEKGLEIQPNNMASRFNYAITLRDATQFNQALEQLDICQKAQPDDPKIQWERALCLLYLGQFEQGWRSYEARWRIGELPARQEICPQWQGQGESLKGKRLLLYAEQGYGDTILAARFIPWLKQQEAHITLECKPELHRLFDCLPVDQLIEPDGQSDSQETYDYHCALMSLPGVYGVERNNIPEPAKLAIPDQSVEKLSFINKMFAEKLKVGIVWSGSLTFKDNHNRSTSLGHFIKLAQNPNIQLFSLQKGPCQKDIESFGFGPLVVDLGNQLEDFADTAAAVSSLDLVVMTDSSVAHLAGSLGKPVINMLNYKPYWLYGLQGQSTPWYPSMQLLRQQRPGDWGMVFERVANVIESFCSER